MELPCDRWHKHAPSPRPPRARGKPGLTLPSPRRSLRRSTGGPASPATEAPAQWPPAPLSARTPRAPTLPSPRGSSPRTPQLPGERYLSPARPPSLRSRAHRSESFPCFSSPSLSPPGPSLCRVSRPRLTNPGVPAARARTHARSGPSLSPTGGKQLRRQHKLEPRLLSGPPGSSNRK